MSIKNPHILLCTIETLRDYGITPTMESFLTAEGESQLLNMTEEELTAVAEDLKEHLKKHGKKYLLGAATAAAAAYLGRTAHNERKEYAYHNKLNSDRAKVGLNHKDFGGKGEVTKRAFQRTNSEIAGLFKRNKE